MFYLIENNKIIKHSNKTQIEKYGENNYLKYKNRNKLSFIKAQSDNVLDLIEVGDLVKYDDEIYQVDYGKIINVAWCYFDNIVFKINEIEIQAIYKPNSKGDYIKVWDSK